MDRIAMSQEERVRWRKKLQKEAGGGSKYAIPAGRGCGVPFVSGMPDERIAGSTSGQAGPSGDYLRCGCHRRHSDSRRRVSLCRLGAEMAGTAIQDCEAIPYHTELAQELAAFLPPEHELFAVCVASVLSYRESARRAGFHEDSGLKLTRMQAVL